MNDIQTEFLNAITSHQIVPATTLHFVLDGSIHRFSDQEKPKGNTCWYVAYNGDYPTIVFGNWRQPDARHIFTINGKNLTPEARNAVNQQIKEAQAKAAVERKKMASNAALECQRIYNDAVDATLQHPYFKAKNITHSEAIKGIKQDDDGRLVIPINNIDCELRSLQTIDAKGSKGFHPGGEKRGNFFLIGELSQKIYICEGVSTGLSIFEATGAGVVVAFDASNLLPVAKNIKTKHLDKTIIIAADNDHTKEGNTGLSVAKKISKELGLDYCCPRFEESEGGSDFNDLMALHGSEKVTEDLENIQSVDALCREAYQLSKLSKNEYELKRKETAKALKVRVASLDHAVQNEKKKNGTYQPFDGENEKFKQLMEIAEGYFYFYDNEDNAYVETENGLLFVESDTFRNFLTLKYYHSFKSGVSSELSKTVTGTLSAKARTEGKCIVVYKRLAFVDNVLYVNLADKKQSVVKITCDGWEVIKCPKDIHFLSPNSMCQMPIPRKEGATIDKLRESLNIDSDNWQLLKGFILGALRPTSPYPVLLLCGEAGSGKSMVTKLLKRLIDPNVGETTKTPKT